VPLAAPRCQGTWSRESACGLSRRSADRRFRLAVARQFRRLRQAPARTRVRPPSGQRRDRI